MKRIAFTAIALIVAATTAHALTYHGRVQYARGGKPLANVRVEARSLSGPNLLLLVPQVPYVVVGSTTTRRDGTFALKVPDGVARLRLSACGARAGRDPRIVPRTDRPNIIAVPDDFQPLLRPKEPLYPPKRSNQAMQLTASKPAVYALSVCRRNRILRGMHGGLAAADLVAR